MSRYFIKDIEKLSGIKAHTIRIWEKRYGLVTPKRTQTNIRYYSNNDLKKLLNVSILNRNGVKISRIANMSIPEIEKEVFDLNHHEEDYRSHIENLTLAMTDLDEERLERILSHLFTRLGFDKTLIEVIYPFFNKIGILWLTGSINPAQEHFVSNIIRQKLIVAIDGITATINEKSQRFIMFLPESEWHELGLLFYQYLIKSNNHKVIYLGQSIPLADVIKVSGVKRPDNIFTAITASMQEDQLQNFLREISSCFPKQTIFVGGLQIQEFKKSLPSNIVKVTSAKEFIDTIKVQ
ncbi:MAG: MerR family transcriptional regulator [Bacteroidales bacterium]